MLGYKLATLIIFSGIVVESVRCGVVEDSDGNSIARGLDAKGMLTSLATSLMGRGYGTTAGGASQIVSLNLTNLFVLFLLKALIFAAGSIGAGTWKGGYARSNDGEERIITDEEILMFLSYLTGSPGDNGCLQNIACQQPQQAKKYVAAGDMVLKTAKVLTLDPDASYDYVLQEVEQAANMGLAGADCSRFICSNERNKT